MVRHIFGQDWHRNTKLRWHKAYEKGGRLGPKRGGDWSFLLFTGACIAAWNKERKDGFRRVTYYEIFNQRSKPPSGQQYRYPKVPKALQDKLVKSGFPPPLLAVACCDIIPMNLLTKGERYSFSKQVFKAMVQRLAAKPGGIREAQETAREISNAHFRGDTLGKTRNISGLVSPAGASNRVTLEQCASFLEAIQEQNAGDFYDTISDRRCGFDLDKAEAEPQPVATRQSSPEKIRVPGTKVHNITFHGGFTISRRMASYWRGTASKTRRDEYDRCCAFIRSLLERPWPTMPSVEGMASTVPLFNALLNLSLKSNIAQRKPARR